MESLNIVETIGLSFEVDYILASFHSQMSFVVGDVMHLSEAHL